MGYVTPNVCLMRQGTYRNASGYRDSGSRHDDTSLGFRQVGAEFVQVVSFVLARLAKLYGHGHCFN